MQKKLRQLALLLVFVFTYNLFPAKFVSAVDDIKLISTTSITVEEAKQWAKSNGASSAFIGLADLYWKYSAQRGGVNPAIAYVQAAKETAYGKFGGVINESFNNPCGLKTTAGGDDNDPNAHQKFNSWDEGVQAHLDHLALYAGATGYPRSDTYDPRHFSSIKGTATTAITLGAKWAPSTSYGTEIVKMYNSLINYSEGSKLRGNLEEPSVNQQVSGSTLNIAGWALNPSGIKEIKVYIDDIFKGNATLGISRADVYNAYGSLYKDAGTSGYNLSVDVSNLTAGSKTVRVDQVGNDGTILTFKRTIQINKLPSLGRIDSPSEGQSIDGTSLKVNGWSIAPSGVKEVRIYIDGKLKGTVTPSVSRPDIKNSYPSYSGAENSGYELTVDISDIAGGSRIIKAEEVGNDGTVNVSQRTVSISRLQPLGRIDSPSEGQSVGGNSLKVSGWSIAASGVKSVNIYVDGKLKGTVTPSISRPDIKSAFPSYPGAEKSGYELAVDISDIAGGSRIIKTEEVGNDGTVNTSQRAISINKLQSLGRIDVPNEGDVVKDAIINVSGWAISNSGVKSINIYVDGKLKGTITPSISRPDIKNAFPSYPNAEMSGYDAKIDISDIETGEKVIKVEEISNDGTINTDVRTIQRKKLDPIGRIDSPSENQTITSSTIKVSGWSIASSGVKEVKVYIDGKYKGTANLTIARPDVAAAYPGYPNAEKSGYELSFDVSDITRGNRVIKTEEVANDGTVSVNQRTVNISRKAGIGSIDSPSDSELVLTDSMTISGWGTNDVKTSAANVYIDDVLYGNATIGQSRLDVQAAYPSYQSAADSGFVTDVNISSLIAGKHNIRVDITGADGSVLSLCRDFYFRTKQKLVVVDPGHNSGGDDGAYAYSNGVTYCERDMNMSVALRLQSALQQAGYRVLLTRESTNTIPLDEKTSLTMRANLANSYSADLFISIHHNVFDKAAHGTEVYYTTSNPDSGFPAQDRDLKLSKSKSLAGSSVNNITSRIGTTNRGAKDGNLFVLRNTTMPAVLVECGFIDNPTEAVKLMNPDTQYQISEGIKDAVLKDF